MKLAGREIGQNHAPYFIAEMSGNHNQSLEKALAIVDAAAATGAHALKLQTYTADTLTIDCSEREFFIKDEKSIWKGQSLYDLYKVAMTPWEWHEPIAKRCKEKGITFFSTPFDESAVDFLEKMDVPFYKIASFENNHLPLIRKVAKTGKPLIVSTGMATLIEIAEMVECARSAGAKDIVLLKCTSAYPASPDEMNLNTIPHLKQAFNVEVGLSDHTMGVSAVIASVVLGASVIEKHFIVSRAEGGVDSSFSIEQEEFKRMIEDTNHAWKALGSVRYGITKDEERSRIFRRSIYFTADIKSGEELTEKNVRIIRPGLGLSPKYLPLILGRKAKQDIQRGTAVSWDLFS
jgi:N-acetylneuraminate synthase